MAESATAAAQPAAHDEPRPDAPAVASRAAGDEALVEQDLLVEDVSIDGMCGVY